jgi:asparagine synthase (glutamine-hydrolysing)
MDKVTIERDKTGATPLFYTVHNNRLYHSVNIRELISTSGIKPRLDAQSVATITLTGPGRGLHNAVFAGVYELPPGYRAEYEDGKLTLTQYWKPQSREHTDSFDETAVKVREMLTNSIKRSLAGKPCLFLSGGLDSSIIGAVMREEGVDITSYSVDYAGNSENFKESAFSATQDTPFVNEMVELLGSKHRNVVLDTKQLFGALEESVLARRLPGMADVDAALLLFCKEVGKTHKQALSGECADELFGGYRWYFDEELLHNGKQARLPWMQCVDERAGLLREGVLGGIEPGEFVRQTYHGMINAVPYLESDDELTRKRREMFYLNFYGFMQTLCERSYTMSGKAGLEILMPFCDAEIAEYAYNIPWLYKTERGREKGLLRHAFSDVLTESVAWRKKSPFPKTHCPEYMRLVKLALIEILISDDCRITEIYEKKKLNELIESSGASFGKNWFGQLMSAPQIFAYLIQLEYWLREFDVQVDKH